MLWYCSAKAQGLFCANARASSLFSTPAAVATYSHSRLETFEKCPLKYQFKYVQEIEERTEFVEQFLGKRVHEALEKLHREQAAGKPPTLPELLAFLRQEWETDWNENVKIVRRGATEAEYARYAELCVRNYYEKIWPLGKGSTLSLEAHIRFPLDELGVYQMQGFIDRVSRQDDGTYEIHDYKTAKRLPSQQDADHDKQLGLYELGIRAQYPEARQIELIWHYVGLGQTLRSKRSAEQRSRLVKNTVTLIQQIEKTRIFPAHKSALCDWCEYRPQCPAWAPVDSGV